MAIETGNGVVVYPYGVENNGTAYSLVDEDIARVLTEQVYPTLGQLPVGSRVLDLGSGQGRLIFDAPRPPERVYSFVGVDKSPEAIAELNAKAARLGFGDEGRVGDITKLDLGGERFDAAISWRVLHGLPPSEHPRVLQGLAETLPKGASLFVAVLSDRDWKRQALEAAGSYTPGAVNDCADVMSLKPKRQTWPLYFFSGGELEQLGQQAGFGLVSPLVPFQESTGFPHLKEDPTRRFVTYHFAHFQRLG